MKMNEKLEEVKAAISNAFEETVTAGYCFMLKHPVISTCIGTLAGAAVATGVTAIVSNAKPAAIEHKHVTKEEAEMAKAKLIYMGNRFIEDHPDEWAEMNNE